MGLVGILAALCAAYATEVAVDTQEEWNRDIYVTENISGGYQLRLSDGSLYEIAPQDQTASSTWLFPFPIDMAPSNDPNFPCKLTNRNTGESIKGRLVTPAP